jgi:hypothetical protein
MLYWINGTNTTVHIGVSTECQSTETEDIDIMDVH